MSTRLIVHGHFYQPPRENPWTETIEREISASPFHDWNERIHQECYRSNAFARINDGFRRVERIVNNYTALSFNFGPTLLSWIEREHPTTYARILEADRESASQRGGHGNAIAQGYNHTILPLSNDRDLRTQVRWGVADFEHRFGRRPEGMWLPETAADDRTLEALIEEGIRFTILSPHQAERVRPLSGSPWKNVADGSIDPTQAYKWSHRDGSKRHISLFFYDGGIAHSIAFGGALHSSQSFLDQLGRGKQGPMRNVATDGETYGHHSRFGDLALAYALDVEAAARGYTLTNYGAYLEEQPPSWEVEIKRGDDDLGTAWSCAHGVGRWAKDCGCHTGGRAGWNQRWRKPLRDALDHLRDASAELFEEAGSELFRDPWAARDSYVEVLLERGTNRDAFLARHSRRPLSGEARVRALSLLELQCSTLLMYTSCGWFFADISGLEPRQILKYAGRALDRLEEIRSAKVREDFLAILSEARSNILEEGTGADVFRRVMDQHRVTPKRVVAHVATVGLVDAESETPHGEAGGYRYQRREVHQEQHGRVAVSAGRVVLEATDTGRAHDLCFSALHFGGADFYCAVRAYDPERFRAAVTRLFDGFRNAPLPTMLRLIEELFGPDEFGLEQVLDGGRERVSSILLGGLVDRLSQEYAAFYEDNWRTIDMLKNAGFDLPVELRAAAEMTLSKRLEREISAQERSIEPARYKGAVAIAEEAKRHGFRLELPKSSRTFSELGHGAVLAAIAAPDAEHLRAAVALIELAQRLGLEPNLSRAQEALYAERRTLVASPELHSLSLLLGFAPGVFPPA